MTYTPEAAVWEAHSLEEHVELIQGQISASLDDPETLQLARKIVGRKVDYRDADGTEYVSAWGQHYVLAPPYETRCHQSDSLCAITSLWNFYVSNIRYTEDPDGYDLYMTVRVMLEAGGGDCDDATIFFATMLRALGYSKVFARVVSQNGKRWQHIYALVGLPKTGKFREYLALDPTVEGYGPGDEFTKTKATRDFRL